MIKTENGIVQFFLYCSYRFGIEPGMDVVGWYVLYQKCSHKDGIQNQNFDNIPIVVCHCIDNISCDDWKNPGWRMLDNEKENGTSQRAIVSLEKRKKRAQVIFSVPAEDVHHGSFFLPEILF